MRKRVGVFLTAFVLSFSLVMNNVYADTGAKKKDSETTSEDTSKSDEAEATLKSLGISEENIAKGKAWVSVLRSEGYSDASISAILANSCAESHWNPLADEGGKNGGLFGFTPMTNFSNSDFNKQCTHEKGTAGGQSVCADGACQFGYMLSQLSGAIQSYSSRLSTYNESLEGDVAEELKTHKWDTTGSWSSRSIDILKSVPVVSTLDDFKKIEDPIGGTAIFLITYERAAGTYVPCGLREKARWHNVWNSKLYGDKTGWDFFLAEFNKDEGRLTYAESIYTWITGSSFDSSDTSSGQTEQVKQEQENVAQALYKQGYWSEEELSAYCKLNEINFQEIIDMANSDNLTSRELSNLKTWEDVVADDKENEGFIHITRVIVSLFGILLLIWCVLIYLAYWFDRINNIFDLDLLVILTLGKLRISETEDDCTFSLASLTKESGIRTVNHRAVLGICLTGIAFGVLVISGYLYKVISALIYTVLDWLS